MSVLQDLRRELERQLDAKLPTEEAVRDAYGQLLGLRGAALDDEWALAMGLSDTPVGEDGDEDDDPDPFRDLEPGPAGGIKTLVHVPPHMREGHPVHGYTYEREGGRAAGAVVEHLRGDDNPFVNPDLSRASRMDPRTVQEILDTWHGMKFGDFVVSVEEISGSPDAFDVEGGVYVGEDRIGTFERQFTYPRVENVLLMLKRNYRGAGFASAFYRESEAMYRRLGYERIDISAGNVGAYAWARQGFQFRETAEMLDLSARLRDEPPVSRRETERFAAKLPTRSEARRYENPADLPEGKFRTPAEIAVYGRDRPWTDEEGREMWLGKWFLLDNSWNGYKDIGPAEAKALTPEQVAAAYDAWVREKERSGGETMAAYGEDGNLWFEDDDDFWQRVEAGTKAALVRVRAYTREGHPVSAYVRHGEVTVSSKVIKTSGEAAALRADQQIDAWLREFEDGLSEIRALPVRRLTDEWRIDGVPIRDYRGQATWYGGGMSIDKYDFGDGIKYGISGGEQSYVKVPEDEFEQTARERILDAREQMEKNWRRAYRGKIAKRTGQYLESHRRLDAAIAANDANPRYRKLREWAQIPDYVIPVAEEAYGTPAYDNKDVLTTAFRHHHLHATHLNMLAVLVNVRWKPGDVLYSEPKPITPGQYHATDGSDKEAGLLRHEWTHSLFVTLTDEQRAQFASFVPDDPERVAAELSKYAATHLRDDPEERRVAERYREEWGPYGHYTETFSEAVTVVTDPDFKREEWADWIGEFSDWLDALMAEER